MSFWTRGAQANEMARFSATHTLSDFPLLIGEILRRGDLRSRRQASTTATGQSVRQIWLKLPRSKGLICYTNFDEAARQRAQHGSRIIK